MRASKIMTPDPVTVLAVAPLARAVELMDQHDIRHLPVVEDGEVAGICSDRELLQATGWSKQVIDERVVRDVMRFPFETAGPGEPLGSVCAKLLEGHIGCVPVVHDGGLIGMITEADVVRAFVELAASGALDGAADELVARHMTPFAKMKLADRETSIEEAAETLRFENVRHLPILDRGVLTGIVSDRDLRLAQGRGLPASTPVKALVPPDVVVISPEARLSEACDLLAMHKIGALLVLDSGRLAGILTSTDVLEYGAELDWTRAPA